jgi:hypothetical protein
MLICIIWVKYRTKTVHQLAKSGIVAVIAGLCLAISFTGFILSIMHTTVAITTGHGIIAWRNTKFFCSSQQNERKTGCTLRENLLSLPPVQEVSAEP